jgi:hypothetical protein
MVAGRDPNSKEIVFGQTYQSLWYRCMLKGILVSWPKISLESRTFSWFAVLSLCTEVPLWIDLDPNNDGHSKLGASDNYHLCTQKD